MKKQTSIKPRSPSFVRAALFAGIAVVFFACVSEDNSETFPALTGEYLGQTPPGDTAELFAPGIVSTGLYTRDVAMTPEGDEIYFGVLVGGLAVIMETKLVDGRWTKPAVAPFSRNSDYLNLEPHISPDGQHFYFLSTRPPEGEELAEEEIRAWVHQDIWAMDRVENGWGEPYNPGPPINTDAAEFFPSVTRDGTMYFTRGVEDSQESYIIVCMSLHEDGLGRDDYFIVFRDESDNWSTPINMGEHVNTPRGGEFSPYVSPDGKYFFFMAARTGPAEPLPALLTADFLRDLHAGPQNGDVNIYWMDAGFIEELRPGS